jgi:hypothetical protein
MAIEAVLGRREFVKQAAQAVATVAVCEGMTPAAAQAAPAAQQAATIPVRTLGKTELKLPILGYGGAALPKAWRNPLSYDDRVALVPAGQTYGEPVMGFDCHATALAVAGVELAERRKPSGRATTPEGSRPTATSVTHTRLDGVNLVPFVTGEAAGRPHDQLFWRAGRQDAARVGDWKLVTIPQAGGSMLFNLQDDIGEQTDLAASQPAKLKELQTAFAEWEKGTQVAKWVRQDQRNAEIGGRLKPASERTTRRPAASGSRIDTAFEAADKNNDGKLSREEYPQPGVFNAIDADKDGFATSDEVRTYFRNRRGSSQQEPQP